MLTNKVYNLKTNNFYKYVLSELVLVLEFFKKKMDPRLWVLNCTNLLFAYRRHLAALALGLVRGLLIFALLNSVVNFFENNLKKPLMRSFLSANSSILIRLIRSRLIFSWPRRSPCKKAILAVNSARSASHLN